MSHNPLQIAQVMSAFLVVIATVVFVASGNAQKPEVISQSSQDSGCQSQECEERVADRQREQRARQRATNARWCKKDPKCNARVARRRVRERKERVVAPYNAKLEAMAQCESTGRWFIATGNGFYGGLQFTLKTWRWVGGKGYPHHASILEQKYRAVRLIEKPGGGYGHWPNCA